MAMEGSFHTGSTGMDHAFSIVEGIKSSMVVMSACKLEVFDLVGNQEGGVTASGLASDCGWDGDCTERLLNALTALGLLKAKQDTYVLTDAGDVLRKGSPTSLHPYVTSVDRFMDGLRAIPDEVITGSKKSTAFPHHVVVHKPAPAASNTDDVSKQSHGHHKHGGKMPVLQRYKMYDGMARAHVHALATAFDLSHYKNIVDLGGGSGTLAFELARMYPSSHVTLYEVPTVIDLVKEHFLSGNENTGVQLVSGDFFENDIPDADLYILAKIIHDWNTDQTKTLLNKVAGKLQAGGAIILMEKCLHDAKDGPITASVWDMLLLSHCAGRIRSGSEYRELLCSVGFKDVRIAKSQDMCTYDVIYAVKA